jgi:uncharacterized protein
MKKLSLYVFFFLFSVLNNGLAADFEKGLKAYESKKYKKAFKEWKPLAEDGFENAQLGIGHLYKRGKGVSLNHKKAFKWYQLAADQGNAQAQYHLAFYYLNFDEYKNNDLAFKWFKLSADQGYVESQSSLAFMHEEGLSVEKNINKAIKYYYLAAEKDDFLSQFKLYKFYEDGKVITQDLEQAKKWYELIYKEDYDYEKVQAERQEDAITTKAKKLYGEAIWESDKSINYFAFHKFKESADLGHMDSQYLVAMAYKSGLGVKFNSDLAGKYFKLAAAQGHKEAKKWYELHYKDGYVFEKPTGKIFITGYIFIGLILFAIVWIIFVLLKERKDK